MKNKINSFSLFFFITLTFIFWILILHYLGVYEIAIIPRSGVLSYTFNWWESTSIDKHLFLGNYLPNETYNGTVYTTYTYPFYFINYTLLAPFRYLFHMSYEKSQNLLPYFNVLFFIFIIYRLKRKEIQEIIQSKNLYYLTWIFLIFGIIITNALPWTSMLRHNQENLHMPIALLFCILSLTIIKREKNEERDRKFLIIGSIIASISPIYFPAWILCYIYTETDLKVRKKMIINAFLVFTINFINYIIPLIAANSLRLKSSASGYLYRSGLDGSSDYFNSILSVIYNPHSEQHTSSTIILIISAIYIGRKQKEDAKIYFKQLIFTLIPFASIVILFPQFSSIHMYLIEFLLVVPPIFLITYKLINFEFLKNIQPKEYATYILFFTFIIMSQLLEIAKYFKLNHFLKELIN